MKIEEIQCKYSLTTSDINSITNCMLQNLGLEETMSAISNKLTAEKVFAVASLISKSIFNSPIDEICPKMTLQRISINESKKALIDNSKFINSEVKKLRSINEDISYLRMEKIRAA